MLPLPEVALPSGTAYADETAVSAEAKPPKIPAKLFAELPSLQQIEMSPDAEHISYITPHEGRKHLFIHPRGVATVDNLVVIPPIRDADIAWFTWANNDQLLISYRFTSDDPFVKYVRTAMFSVSKDGKEWVDMAKPDREQRKRGYTTSPAQFKDRVLSHLRDDPDHILQQIDSDRDGDAEIRKVNVRNGKFKRYQASRGAIQHWWLDAQKEPRMGWGYRDDNKTRRYIYKDPDTDDWDNIEDTSYLEASNFQFLRFTNDPRLAYALAPNSEGRMGLVKYDIRKAEITEEVFFLEDVDLANVQFDNNNEIKAYVYTDDVYRRVMTNKFLNALIKKVYSLLPGGDITLVDYNQEKQIYLFRFSSPQEEGEYYVLDMKTKGLTSIGTATRVNRSVLSDVQRVDIAARDGLVMPSYLTLPKGYGDKNLPTVIMPHGGPHARDTMDYDYWVQFLANRGFAVLQPNFRGSSGYGAAYENMGKNEWGRKMQQDVTDATRWMIDNGYADPDRICIVGASYGGYAALMGAAQEPDLYACAVSINGVANLERMIRNARKFIGGKSYRETIIPDGMDAEDVSPYHQADKIKAPVLLIHAKDDPVVPYIHSDEIYKRLRDQNPQNKLITFDHADHFLDNEESRLATLEALEAFLTEQLIK
ncbi:peptidase S9 [Kordiimonas sediminis]|uniref:Peptidase S9 n=2 Tax=Kordiimonas sediminis TaxID=1735581 RepID=A0A919ARV0_9PROT|nr:peptidase S9 [Kordiimonas sediminis]